MNNTLQKPASVVSTRRILCTPSAFARTSLLYVQEIGTLTALKRHTSTRINLPSYLFFAVLKGSGVLNYQGQQYNLYPGSCVLIDCSVPYSHSTGDEGTELWTIQWVHFNGPNMAAIYRKYCERGGRPVFYFHSLDTVSRIWDSLINLAASSDALRDLKMNQYLSELIVVVSSEALRDAADKAAPKRENISDVKEYLDQHYAEKISMDELAARFLISASYLSHSFRDRFGMSISSYLLSVRITHAKQLLRFSEKSIEEIGYAVGIGAAAYFSRVFKNVEGVSPARFRAQW